MYDPLSLSFLNQKKNQFVKTNHITSKIKTLVIHDWLCILWYCLNEVNFFYSLYMIWELRERLTHLIDTCTMMTLMNIWLLILTYFKNHISIKKIVLFSCYSFWDSYKWINELEFEEKSCKTSKWFQKLIDHVLRPFMNNA